ncbi:MAG TPA: hypothetical protein VGD27_13475 [Longimicrobiales bacterium]
MTSGLQVVDGPLRYLISVPPIPAPRPVLLFLHGYHEAAPEDIHITLTKHSPLNPGAAPLARAEFIVVAPQLPRAGDLWHAQVDAVESIVREVQGEHGGDVARTYLTGFSFGGNGVFDIGIALPQLWAALWSVDPTRVPHADPGLPVWLSSGALSRDLEGGFVGRLHLLPLSGDLGEDRVFTDDRLDHVGTAASAYANVRAYEWLLMHRRVQR